MEGRTRRHTSTAVPHTDLDFREFNVRESNEERGMTRTPLQ